jgi:hypothetical protein
MAHADDAETLHTLQKTRHQLETRQRKWTQNKSTEHELQDHA